MHVKVLLPRISICLLCLQCRRPKMYIYAHCFEAVYTVDVEWTAPTIPTILSLTILTIVKVLNMSYTLSLSIYPSNCRKNLSNSILEHIFYNLQIRSVQVTHAIYNILENCQLLQRIQHRRCVCFSIPEIQSQPSKQKT